MNIEHYKRYCKDYENIENYQKALADNFKGWHCHHRLETHTSDGERRLVDITQKELKALNMYYHRPAEELIFLPRSEHEAFRKGKPRSAETRRKLSEAANGRKMSAESKKKNSEAHKGKKHNEESKEKIRSTMKKLHWYNNGEINTRAKECPPGFITGRLQK